MIKKFLFTLFVSLIFLVPVYADTVIYNVNPSTPSTLCSTSNDCNTNFSQAVTDIMSYYESNYKSQYPYYILTYEEQNAGYVLRLVISPTDTATMSYRIDNGTYFPFGFSFVTVNDSGYFSYNTVSHEFVSHLPGTGGTGVQFSYPIYNVNYYGLIDTNATITNTADDSVTDYTSIEIHGFYQDNIELPLDSTIPTYFQLSNYSSWQDFVTDNNSNLTTVNLDNYPYVILSLKDYSQTTSFATTLYVKGQVGITPVYNYGQTSKDQVTGSQVQDRCNLSYNDYTSYPFYILQSDLQNNSIYYVKECSSGSSFKFDNTVFDITYISDSNADTPSVTINGNTYDTIPYNELPSTATQNEVDNYIPGEVTEFTGGIDNAISQARDIISEFWSSIVYFTSFVTQLFSALPPELHAILISAFAITIFIGLIKHFTG